MSSSVVVCPLCNKPIPGDAPHGLCPSCMLNAALGTKVVPSGASSLEGTRDQPAGRWASSHGVLDTLTVVLRDAETSDGGASVGSASAGPSGRARRYQLFGEIARGGMGAVWKGRDTDLGRDLAIKVLLEEHR